MVLSFWSPDGLLMVSWWSLDALLVLCWCSPGALFGGLLVSCWSLAGLLVVCWSLVVVDLVVLVAALVVGANMAAYMPENHRPQLVATRAFPSNSVPFAVTAAGSEWHASGVVFHCLEISAGTCFWFERVCDAGVL